MMDRGLPSEGAVLARIARLYYEDNLTQDEIAELMNVSRPSVSRLLALARKSGVVQIRVVETSFREPALEEAVKTRFGLRDAVVVSVPNVSESALVRKNIGYFAARTLSEWIRSGQTVGLGQGRTLRELVGRMAPSASLTGVSVVQLLGDIGPLSTGQRSSDITRVLADRFRAVAYFVTAPAIVESPIVRHGLMTDPGIQKAYRLYGELDIAFVGVGSILDHPLVHSGLLSPAVARELARRGIVGDLVGHFLDAGGRVHETELAGRTVGIDLASLKRCPMMVAVAGGSEKEAPLLAALRSGLVAAVATDHRTAAAALAADSTR